VMAKGGKAKDSLENKTRREGICAYRNGSYIRTVWLFARIPSKGPPIQKGWTSQDEGENGVWEITLGGADPDSHFNEPTRMEVAFLAVRGKGTEVGSPV